VSPLVGSCLRDGILRDRSGAPLLMIKRGNGVIPNPDPVWEVRENDIVLILGTPEQLAAAAGLFEHGEAA
jgi:monovalent cation:H+ antiporter-2, CPA2 family